MWSGIFGPVFLTTGIFAMVAGVIVFIAVFRILYEKELHGVCYCMIVCVVLEVALYVSSNFIHDYTKFNLYFLIDFVLTIVNMLLLPKVSFLLTLMFTSVYEILTRHFYRFF